MELLRAKWNEKKRNKYDANYGILVAWLNGVGNGDLHMVHRLLEIFCCSHANTILVGIVVVVVRSYFCCPVNDFRNSQVPHKRSKYIYFSYLQNPSRHGIKYRHLRERYSGM